mgnify:CR=1 FL=1
MNDEMEKITSSKLPLDAYNEINSDSIPKSDNLTRAEKIRRQKLKEEEERLKSEFARTARQVEDMEAILSFAASKVKTDERQRGRKVVPEERNIVIMSEALRIIANADKDRKVQDRIVTEREELASHIRGSR